MTFTLNSASLIKLFCAVSMQLHFNEKLSAFYYLNNLFTKVITFWNSLFLTVMCLLTQDYLCAIFEMITLGLLAVLAIFIINIIIIIIIVIVLAIIMAIFWHLLLLYFT